MLFFAGMSLAVGQVHIFKMALSDIVYGGSGVDRRSRSTGLVGSGHGNRIVDPSPAVRGDFGDATGSGTRFNELGGNMRARLGLVLGGCLLLTLAAAAQTAKPNQERRSVTDLLNRSISNFEREFTPAAEAMPEEKFGFAPTNGEFKGVRTFGQQIKHVAAVNYELAAALLEQKPPVDINDEAGPAAIVSKADILKYLKDSFEYVHKAIGTINDSNLTETVKSPFGEGSVSRLGLAMSVSSHGFDHYGQMVEYLRMNGIIPPASR